MREPSILQAKLDFGTTPNNLKKNMTQRTLIILKPDCMEKKLVGTVIQRFQNAGLDIVACKMAKLEESVLEEHYAHIVGKPYYPPLLDFMRRRSVILMVLEGDEAVSRVRNIIGPTNSAQAPAGTVRGDFGLNQRENIVHASDSEENAKIEIARFFKDGELF